MTIRYAAQRTSADKLAGIITGLGYRVERVTRVAATRPAGSAKRVRAVLPADAPDFFRAAFERAKKRERPLVIDFWATWCAPCKKLKHETLADEKVAKRIADVELVFVDVDKYPELAKAYGVVSVPDVFFVDAGGIVVDRLRNFEPADKFVIRLDELAAAVRTPEPKSRDADADGETHGAAMAKPADDPGTTSRADSPKQRRDKPERKDADRGARGPGLTTLDGTLEPLIDAFNEHPGRRRFVTLLSPT